MTRPAATNREAQKRARRPERWRVGVGTVRNAGRAAQLLVTGMGGSGAGWRRPAWKNAGGPAGIASRAACSTNKALAPSAPPDRRLAGGLHLLPDGHRFRRSGRRRIQL